MEYSFPGMPTPNLDVLFMICRQMKNWLDIESSHVVVIQCQETKNRSFLVASAFMALFHFEAFSGTVDALNALMECSVSEIKKPEKLLYPSQIRQLSYFDEILNEFIVSFPHYSPSVNPSFCRELSFMEFQILKPLPLRSRKNKRVLMMNDLGKTRLKKSSFAPLTFRSSKMER